VQAVPNPAAVLCGAAAGDISIDSSERTATVNDIQIRHKR
jgi:hypothetical protein